ncbi:hypothetical protein B0H16DRAFT_1452140 [Mycena metata]|uniref:Uncharacterized protein n=1 Tax=Mycena metata TaxID=1033252 RepID=A0AAD7H708_9AGAR|nr:hypothetical protein B0H16DRAFT_1478620 [Mycena metata]KAJ7770725.1 hypothetical protein B0H16DRAFT_1452140 [Mycena metata]
MRSRRAATRAFTAAPGTYPAGLGRGLRGIPREPNRHEGFLLERRAFSRCSKSARRDTLPHGGTSNITRRLRFRGNVAVDPAPQARVQRRSHRLKARSSSWVGILGVASAMLDESMEDPDRSPVARRLSLLSMAKATKSKAARTTKSKKTPRGKKHSSEPPLFKYSWTERRADAAALTAARAAWARRQEEVATAQARLVSDLATAFGVSEAEIILDREAWLSAPGWQPSRYGWEQISPFYPHGPPLVVKYPVDTMGTGWGPQPGRLRETDSGLGWGSPETSSTAGAGDGWGTGSGWRTWEGTSTAGGAEGIDGTAS